MSSTAIPIRRPDLAITDAISRHWLGGNAFASHFFDALSSTFPDGEAFFVRSVQHYRSRIGDPELLRAISGFAGQEAQHRQQHDRHLQLLLDSGYPALAARNRIMRRVLTFVGRRHPRGALAATAALEHLTAILARRLLRDTDRWRAEMDPRMARLWQWHALEEAEHKAVAFDVLMQVAPSHPRRVVVQLVNSLGLFLEVLDRTLFMLWKDGLLFRRATWRQGRRFLFGADGFLRGLGPDYRRWYARDFHPDDVDDSALIERWRARLIS